MARISAILLSFVIIGGILVIGYRWAHLHVAGESTVRGLAIALSLIVSCFVVRWGLYRMGRQSIETEAYKRGVLDLRGAKAIAAGRRLIILGCCFFYFGVTLAWIIFLALVIQ